VREREGRSKVPDNNDNGTRQVKKGKKKKGKAKDEAENDMSRNVVNGETVDVERASESEREGGRQRPTHNAQSCPRTF
jgi:hypothetical protein